MQSDIYTDFSDVTSLNIKLNELRSRFDQGMREGQDLSELKETYLQMKELECHIKALQWDPERQYNQRNDVLQSWR